MCTVPCLGPSNSAKARGTISLISLPTYARLTVAPSDVPRPPLRPSGYASSPMAICMYINPRVTPRPLPFSSSHYYYIHGIHIFCFVFGNDHLIQERVRAVAASRGARRTPRIPPQRGQGEGDFISHNKKKCTLRTSTLKPTFVAFSRKKHHRHILYIHACMGVPLSYVLILSRI